MDKPILLLVDDCPIMCKFYELFLSKKYKTHTYTDPLAALNLIRSGFKPDLIVSDLNMPMLNGIGLIVSLRKFLPDTPVLVVSVNDTTGEMDSLAAGANKYMLKPVQPTALAEQIDRLLEKKGSPSLLGRLFGSTGIGRKKVMG